MSYSAGKMTREWAMHILEIALSRSRKIWSKSYYRLRYSIFDFSNIDIETLYDQQ